MYCWLWVAFVRFLLCWYEERSNLLWKRKDSMSLGILRTESYRRHSIARESLSLKRCLILSKKWTWN